MTPDQISLVQETFALASPRSEAVAAMFYDRLFEVSPELRPMFPGDIGVQGRKLMSTLRVIVIGLRDADEVAGVLHHLGQIHANEHSVRPEHYEPFGATLLWTLEQVLGSAFTDDVKEAWAAAYALVASTMAGTPDHA